MTTQQLALAKALAAHLGIGGRVGGWLYDSKGSPVCQGWQAFWQLARRRRWVVDYQHGTRLAQATSVDGYRIDWRQVPTSN